MKLTKKKVFVVALALCLFAILSMGTLAWFSASDSVENKFMIADSEDDTPDKIFSVSVWENTPETDKDLDGYEYKNVLPGDKLKKEARVENTGHYDQYIRVTVTISNAEAWIDALGVDFKIEEVFDGFEAEKWNHISCNLEDAVGIPEEIIYVLYYDEIVEAGDVVELFNNVIIPKGLTDEQAAEFGGNFSINVKADAVQTKNVGAEAVLDQNSKAWTAFQTVEHDQEI